MNNTTKTQNFTEAFIAHLPPAEKGKRYLVKDAKNPALFCRVTELGTKSFIVYKKFQGKPIKATLGKHPEMSVLSARKKAAEVLALFAENKNPNVEKRKLCNNITLKDLFKDYIEKHAKVYTKERTLKGNQDTYRLYLSKWSNRQIKSLSKVEIESALIKLNETNGIHAANKALTLLRHVINKGIEWGLDFPNPTIGIKKYRTQSRDRFLKPEELQRFFKALQEEPNIIFKNYFLISLYTGQRRSNVLSMRWENINFEQNTWYIPETKNGDPLTIPLVSQVVDILQEMPRVSVWVFPSATSKSGHIEEPKKAWHKILKRAQIENLRIHDLRRTLGSYQAIEGTSLNIIGKSLGHKSQQATAIYARLNLDPVRESMKKAVSLMDKYKESDNISILPQEKREKNAFIPANKHRA